MTARDELRTLIQQSDYAERISVDFTKTLMECVERGETEYDGIKGFYISLVPAGQHSGLLLDLGLVESYGIGEDMVGYPLTKKGEDLGRRLLEESHQTANSAR